MGVAIVGFVFPHTLQSLLEESFTDKIIQTYREDPDLQNFIDFGQQEVRMSYQTMINIYSYIKLLSFAYSSNIYKVLYKFHK